MTSQLLKMEHAGGTHWRPEIWDNQAWPVADRASTHLAFQDDMPAGGTAMGGMIVRVGSHELVHSSPAKRSGPHNLG